MIGDIMADPYDRIRESNRVAARHEASRQTESHYARIRESNRQTALHYERVRREREDQAKLGLHQGASNSSLPASPIVQADKSCQTVSERSGPGYLPLPPSRQSKKALLAVGAAAAAALFLASRRKT
jgi:hypothetical protein